MEAEEKGRERERGEEKWREGEERGSEEGMGAERTWARQHDRGAAQGRWRAHEIAIEPYIKPREVVWVAEPRR